MTSDLQSLTIAENRKKGPGRGKAPLNEGNNNKYSDWTSHPANTTPARDYSLGVLPRRVNFYDDSTVHSTHPLHLNSTSLDDPYISPNFIPLGDKRGRSLGSSSSPSSSDLYQDLQAGYRAPHNKGYLGSEPQRTSPPESNAYRTYQEQRRSANTGTRTPPRRVPQPQQRNQPEPRTLDAHQRDMQRRGERAAPMDLRYKELPPPWNIDIQCYDQSEMSDLMQIRKNYANLKFDGKPENYSVWRSRFIICIHRRHYADEEKCIILEEMLVDNASKAKQRIPPGWYGYKQTIENLERLFGSRLDDVSRLMALLDARSIPDNNAPLLRKLLDDLQELRYMFWELNRLHSFDDITLYTKVLRCLPTRYRIDFEERMIMEGYQDDDRSTSSLVGWLENKYKVLQRVPTPTYNPKQRYTAFQSLDEEMAMATNIQTAQAEKKPPTCSLCQLQHYYPECKQFLQMHPDQRLTLIRKKKLCARCLLPNHISATCKAEIICQQCGRRHHPLLHGSRWRRTDATLVSQDFLDTEIPEPPDSSNSLDENNIPQLDGCSDLVLTTGEKDSPSTSLRFAAVKLHRPDNASNQITCNAVLDDGASFNCLDTEVADKLQLDGPKTTIAVKGFGDTKSHFDSTTTNVVLTSLDDKQKYSTDIIVKTFPKPVGKLYPVDWNTIKHNYNYLSCIDFAPILPNEPIKLIIGNCNPLLMSALSPDIQKDDLHPVARLTRLGYTAVGPMGHCEADCFPVADTSCIKAFVNSTDKRLSMAHSHKQHQLAVDVDGVLSANDARTIPVRLYDYSEDDLALDDIARCLWQDDPPPAVTPPLTALERQTLDRLAKARTIANNKATIDVLWKDKDGPHLPANFQQVKKEQFAIYYSMRANGTLDEYNTVFDQWLAEGFIEDVPREDGSLGYYIPHFPVIRQDATTTKVRPVMNCRKKYMGTSLNDEITKGPNIFTDLRQVLLHFRQKKYAFAADVKNMFLKIRMPPKDRQFHRFLWIQDGQARQMQFTSFIFGSACSPLVAVSTAKWQAKEMSQSCPLGAEIINDRTLMDDSMSSHDTLDEAVQATKQLREIYASIDMDIRKFASNSLDVLKALPEEVISTEVDLTTLDKTDSGNSVKTLGLQWLCHSDTLKFRLRDDFFDPSLPITKRRALSTLMKIFDPLGLIAPAVLPGKLLFQAIWLFQAPWDYVLPPDHALVKTFKTWAEQIKGITHLSLPRAWSSRPVEGAPCVYHIFVDASEKAYGLCIYRVQTYKDQNFPADISLVLAKSKLNDLKPMTIPALELKAAVAGFKAAEFIATSLSLDVKHFRFWSDSKCLHHWLQTPAATLQRGIRNSVSFLQSVTEPSQWLFVPTDLNPADVASRGSSVKALINDTLWWSGPAFLKPGTDIPAQFAPKVWPEPHLKQYALLAVPKIDGKQGGKLPKSTDKDSQPRKSGSLDDNELTREDIKSPCPQLLFVKRFSKWNSLLKFMAYWNRWKFLTFISTDHSSVQITIGRRPFPSSDKKLQGGRLLQYVYDPPLQKALPPFTDTELRDAETSLMRIAQAPFRADIARIEKRKQPESVALRKCNPFLEDGILRVGSRLLQSEILLYDSKFPVILPAKSHVAELILQHVHANVLHHGGGHLTAINLTRSKHWILKGTQLARSVVVCCAVCRRWKPRGQHQLMGPLPKERIDPKETNPLVFDTACMDIAGPVIVTCHAHKQKRWILLFVCALTKALHTEIVTSLSTNELKNAIDRFLARRPRPTKFITDNGSNFVGLAKQFNTLLSSSDFFQTRYPGITWQFNPPMTPHSGGIFERMVQTLKKCLVQELNAATLDDPQLLQATMRSEFIINSRPITPVSTDPSDLEALTPNHFLLGKMNGPLAPTPDGWPLSRTWEYIQSVSDKLWIRFQKELLPQLHKMPKWWRKMNPFHPGQLVMVLDSNPLKTSWTRGRIVEVFQGPDQLQRTVTVRTSSGTYKRPVHLLAPLLSEENLPQEPGKNSPLA